MRTDGPAYYRWGLLVYKVADTVNSEVGAMLHIRKAGLICVLSTATLFADTIIEFTGPPANTEHGTRNGFASGTMDGLPFDDLICDDWSHTTYMPSGPLRYYVSSLDTLQHARFVSGWGVPTAADIDKYRAAAILIQGVIDHPDRVADYQYALWGLFSAGVPLDSSASLLLTGTLDLVTHGDISGYMSTFADLRIFTPTQASAANQEFLQISQVPEPSTIILLATVIVLLVSGLQARDSRPRA